MYIEKIEKFIDAGYTKEEINAMLSDGGNVGTVQTQNEHDTSGSELEKSKEQGAGDSSHDSALDTAEMLKTLTSTVEGLKDTVKALQAANVKNADSGGKKPENEINNIMDSFIKTL